MPTPNYWRVIDRLTTADLSPRVSALVDAALHDDATFARALDGHTADAAAPTRTNATPSTRPAGAYLERLDVERFRGIGPKASLRLTPGPGLTLVVGRNGSGKSSLAEGLEMLLTGASLRWEGRKPKKDWTAGWRNLHEEGAVRLQARVAVEGRAEPVHLVKSWKAEDALTDGALEVREGTQLLSGVDALGWGSALQTCRPFLSYNELGRALDEGPAKLFDALEGLLGLEDVATARERIRQARLELDRRSKAHKATRKQLLSDLEASSSDRATRAHDALAPRTPDLDALESLLLTVEEATSTEHERALRQLASLRPPDELALLEAVEAVRDAVQGQASQADSHAGQALQTARLLDQALAAVSPSPDTACPVCQTPRVLDEAWKVAATARATALRAEAEAATTAQRALRQATDALRQLVHGTARPTDHDLATASGADGAHRRWCDAPDAPLDLAQHAETTWPDLARAYAEVTQAASARLTTLQQAWRPLQQRLGSWLDEARALERQRDDTEALRAGEDWLKSVEQDLRDEAFTPIADQSQAIWNALRQQSNVQLARPRLAGTARRRTVQLDITVDGTEGVALGVMSQGELHALALSLFLPRLTRPDSPFRFVVLDDPVQAMDPAKVDGLARVLEEAARTHQVIVFTHDARLSAAVGRLGIDATIAQVERHPDSRVEIKPTQDAVRQHLSDARHLERHQRELGDEVVRTVVPGLCRAAVEAALLGRTWRRELGRGRRHTDIEADIADAKGLHDLAALAFYGDRSAGGQVLPRLDRMGAWAADHFRELKEHAHHPLPARADVRAFIEATDRLSRQVLK
jgi:recombinational DNA repair ATPase RecF